MITNPWFLAIRPKTLPAGAAPVFLGLALAHKYSVQNFSLTTALLTLLCALLLQISSNLINDYYDGVKGLDDEQRLGPPRATSLGLLSSQAVKNGFLSTLFVAFLVGLYLMIYGGVPIIIIGLSSLFFAWAYTGGPYPISYYGLGEIFAFLFFGPIAVWGTWYLQTLQGFNSGQGIRIILWGSCVGFISAALMGVNNLRDRHTDAQKEKRTLATVLGNNLMRKVILILLILSQILAQALLYQNQHHHLYHLIGVTPFFFFSKTWWSLSRYTDGIELNETLATVGKYVFLFSVTYSLILTYL